ncbi:hypothetical protein [Virgifigura deserti]|uniref:hypothetical protein n=1 Tax=Virgifigura deserti TaxID=2268457 RepID=UPI003CCC433A
MDPHIFSAAQVPRGNPAPDLVLFAARRMGTAPQACLVIEGSVAGAQAAVAAEMRVLGFAGGGHCRPGHAERLRAAGAAPTFAHMQHLADLTTNYPPSAVPRASAPCNDVAHDPRMGISPMHSNVRSLQSGEPIDRGKSHDRDSRNDCVDHRDCDRNGPTVRTHDPGPTERRRRPMVTTHPGVHERAANGAPPWAASTVSPRAPAA